jgi:hypothetical protein
MAAFLPGYRYAISHTELQLNVEEVSLSFARLFFVTSAGLDITVTFVRPGGRTIGHLPDNNRFIDRCHILRAPSCASVHRKELTEITF